MLEFLGDALGWVGKNKDWLRPVAQAGIGLFNQDQKSDTESKYLDYLRQKEQENHQNALNSYNQQLLASQSRGGGGGGDGGAGAKATEKNRQIALKKASEQEQRNYKELIKMYQPFANTARELLPVKSQAYQGGVNQMNMLQAYLNSPQELQKMNAAVPSYQVPVPLPKEFK